MTIQIEEYDEELLLSTRFDPAGEPKGTNALSPITYYFLWTNNLVIT